MCRPHLGVAVCIVLLELRDASFACIVFHSLCSLTLNFICWLWSSRNGEYGEYYLLGWGAVKTEVSEQRAASIFRVEE
jgi:hypothetical protein